MPVQFVTKAQVKKGKAAKSKNEVVEIVDQMATLNHSIEPVKPLLKEYEGLRKKLITEYIPKEVDGAVSFEGTSYVVEFSPCANVATITDIQEVKSLLGENLFMQLVKINLEDLKKYLTQDQLESVVFLSKTGPRTHKIKPKDV